jgi:hypothetical protein
MLLRNRDRWGLSYLEAIGIDDDDDDDDRDIDPFGVLGLDCIGDVGAQVDEEMGFDIVDDVEVGAGKTEVLGWIGDGLVAVK